MLTGWQEEHGDLLAALRCTVANAGMNAPRGGAKFDQMHPYPVLATLRRRKAGADGWQMFDAAMDRIAQQGR